MSLSEFRNTRALTDYAQNPPQALLKDVKT